MNPDLFAKAVAEIAAHPVAAVVPFFRGEPLLHPHLIPMLALLRRHSRAEIQLATNALLLNATIARALIDLRIDFISFSLDAVTAKTYNRIRVGGDFKTAMTNVHAFIELKNQIAPHLTVQVSATAVDANQKELDAFSAYWRTRADRVRIYPQHSAGGRFGQLASDSPARNRGGRRPCQKPFTDMVVYYDGRVVACNHDWQRVATDDLGNLTSRSIAAIWNGPPYARLRIKHLERAWERLTPCGHCDHWVAADAADNTVGTVIA